MNRSIAGRLLLSTSLACGLDATAIADDAGKATTEPLTEILVTAQRQQQSVQDVPLSVTAVGAEDIANLNLRNVDAVSAVTPGVVLDTAFSFPTFYIRGIGAQNRAGVGLETPVAIYVDGAYNPRNTGTPFDLVDVSSVEVLKGPQGTLYGRNASGGAILIHSADPEHEWGGRVAAELGNFGHEQFDGMVNIPLNDAFALRIAGRYRSDDGFVDNLATNDQVRGRESTDLRAKLLWEASDSMRNVLAVDYHKDTGVALAAAREDAFDGKVLLKFDQVDSDFAIREPTEGYGINLNTQVDLGSLKITNILNFRHLDAKLSDDNDHSALPILAINAGWGGDTFSEDFQISSDFGGMFDFMAGALYSKDDADSQLAIYGLAFGTPYTGSQIPAGALETLQNIKTESYGGFVEGYIRPADAWTITLGGRLSHDERTVKATAPGSYSQDYSDTQFTPRAVVAYDLGNTNLYASYTRGYLAGGFTIPSFGPGDVLNPEKIDSYEIGAKFASDDRRTRGAVAVYHYTYKDVLVTLCCVNSQAITQNAASAKGTGVEFDLTHQPNDFLTLGIGGSYMKAEFDSFKEASVFVPVYGDEENPDLVTTVVTATEDLSGSRLPRAPEWQGYATIGLEGNIAGGWHGHVNAVGKYTSDFDFTQGGGGPLHTDRQKSYGTIRMSAGIGPDDGKFEIGFYVDNLTDTHYYANRAIGVFGLDSRIAEPRSYGARLEYKF